MSEIRYRLERRRTTRTRSGRPGVTQIWRAFLADRDVDGYGRSKCAARADMRPRLERAIQAKMATPAFRRLERAIPRAR